MLAPLNRSAVFLLTLFLRRKEDLRVGFVVRAIGYSSFQERAQVVSREVSRVQMLVDSELYIDYGLLSGLAAKSELRDLLDELYENLS